MLNTSESDELTVVVFKDNFASRTFRVPLRWISRLGTLIGILAVFAALSTLLATKYYRMARKGSPSRVNELEEELNNLRSSYSTLQAKEAQEADTAKKVAVAVPAPPPQTVSPPPPKTEPVPPAAVARPTGMTALLFQDLPGNVALKPAAQAPVKLAPPKLHWHSGTLQIQSALEYSRSDGGNQQGRIVVLARGPSMLLAYPDAVLNPSSTPVLIAPDHGESFSVSRYREINTEFGPVHNPAAIQEVEILIFGEPDTADGPVSLLIDQLVPVPAPTQGAPKTRKHPHAQTQDAPESDKESDTDTGESTSTGEGAGAKTAPPPAADTPAPWPGSPPPTSTPAQTPPAGGATQ